MLDPARRTWIALGLAAVASWVALYRFGPAPDAQSTICAFRGALGMACPGCGLVRAATLLARGGWVEALALHPLAPLLAVEALVLWGAWGLRLAGDRPPPRRRRWLEAWLMSHAALFAGVWLVRLGAGTLPD